MSMSNKNLPSEQALREFETFLDEITLARIRGKLRTDDWFRAIALVKGQESLIAGLGRLSARGGSAALLRHMASTLAAAVGPAALLGLRAFPRFAVIAGRLAAYRLKKRRFLKADTERRGNQLAERIRHAERRFNRLQAERAKNAEMADMVDDNLRWLFEDMVYDRPWPGSPS